ncbi:MAG: transcription termination/antitermination NusG family protein [Bacteroidales bacterium]|nr:transcription termination/antitermination NusG family protein [Bacteroidales bacterium]
MLSSTPAWVAVMTHPNAETTVAKHFAEANPPIEYYLPMLANRDRRYKHNNMTEKPMFPCYIFARINDKRIYETRTTHGVIYIVSSQHSIIQVPEKEIEAVRRFEATQRKIQIRDTSKLVKGARATILSGEFAGLEGVLVKGDANGNFAVNISVMNMSFVVHIKRSELRPAEEPADTQDNTRLLSIK